MIYLVYTVCVLILNVTIKNKTPSFLEKKQLEDGSVKINLSKMLRNSQKARNNSIKPGLKIAATLTSATVGAQNNNPQLTETTSNISRSKSRCNILNLTDMHGKGLRLKIL